MWSAGERGCRVLVREDGERGCGVLVREDAECW